MTKQDIERVSPEEVRRRSAKGDEPLLVCAYDDEQKCRDMLIEGAITLGELQNREDGLDHDRRIVFYCA